MQSDHRFIKKRSLHIIVVISLNIYVFAKFKNGVSLSKVYVAVMFMQRFREASLDTR